MKKIRAEKTVDKKIIINRMMTTEFSIGEDGFCDNVSRGQKRPRAKAGNAICSVGMIRKGRSWGDYGGVFCGECPYFIPKVKIRMAKEMRG